MKILLYCDGSEYTDQVASFTASLAAGWRPVVTVLGIAENAEAVDPLADALFQGYRSLQTQGVDAEILLKRGSMVHEIVEHTSDCDLVVMGATHNESGSPGSFLRKIYRVIQMVKPPVLVVPRAPALCSKILLCSSGRDDFEAAVEFTGELAFAAQASVLLLHVFLDAPAMYADLCRRKEDQDWLANSTSTFAQTARGQKELLDNKGVPCTVRLTHGCVTDQILAEAQARDCGLIVVGTNPSGSPLESYILGDVTREVVAGAQLPVLVLRASPCLLGFRARFHRLASAFLKPAKTR